MMKEPAKKQIPRTINPAPRFPKTNPMPVDRETTPEKAKSRDIFISRGEEKVP